MSIKKSKLAFVFIIILSVSCEKTFDDSEVTEIKNIAYFKDDMSLVSGKVVLYDNDKNIMEVNYEKGEKNGFKRWWHNNGKLSFEANYKKNKVEGIAQRWYPNGQIKYKGNYKGGKENGVHIVYGKNGEIISEITYMNGKKINSTFELKPFKDEITKSFIINKTKEFTIDDYVVNIVWDEQMSFSENLGKYGGIKSMVITKDTKTVNLINNIEDKIGLGEINLNFYDYNFDGYIDFTIPIDCGKICWYKYYLFNPKLNKFEHNKTWDYLRVKQIDKTNKWIQSESDTNDISNNRKLYKVKGIELIQIETE